MKIAVFPGSFDPITLGHESIVLRSLPLFDKIIVAIGINSNKKYMFPLEKRIQQIEQVFRNYPQIEVRSYEGLTVEFCKKIGAQHIIRGIRSVADFEFEREIGQMNKKLCPEIETVFLLSIPEYGCIASSVIRDIIRNGGNASQFVPKGVDLTI